jgi:hypothetical protein
MKKLYLYIIFWGVFATHSYSQLIITPDTNTQTLVSNFILSGVTATNINYTGAGNTLGSFTNGNSTNIGIPDGIIMTTGSLAIPPFIGSPVSDFASYSNAGAGDSTLDNIIPGFMTYEASILEFDLVPAGNMLEFQYVFASEEYPEFVGSTFNDVFGFFINGANPSGGNYNDFNIALIPGASIPVAINNVNSTLNQSYFVDNLGSNGQSIVFDGFTTVLLAQVNVIPFNTYHLKMTVADAGDGIYDSGIFLKAQSMKSYMTSGINDHDNENRSIYPNPCIDNLNINLSSEEIEGSKISIIDLQGRIIISREISENNTIINISELPSGIYFVKFENLKKTEFLRIVKR